MLLWASAFIALKLAFRYYDPMVVLAGRMLVASCCFIWVVRRFGPVDYRIGDWKLLGLPMLAEPCLYFLFEASAQCCPGRHDYGADAVTGGRGSLVFSA